MNAKSVVTLLKCKYARYNTIFKKVNLTPNFLILLKRFFYTTAENADEVNLYYDN